MPYLPQLLGAPVKCRKGRKGASSWGPCSLAPYFCPQPRVEPEAVGLTFYFIVYLFSFANVFSVVLST